MLTIPDWYQPVVLSLATLALLAIGLLLARLVEAAEAAAEALGTLADSLLAETEAQASRAMKAWVDKVTPEALERAAQDPHYSLTARCSRCGSMMSLCRCRQGT